MPGGGHAAGTVRESLAPWERGRAPPGQEPRAASRDYDKNSTRDRDRDREGDRGGDKSVYSEFFYPYLCPCRILVLPGTNMVTFPHPFVVSLSNARLSSSQASNVRTSTSSVRTAVASEYITVIMTQST